MTKYTFESDVATARTRFEFGGWDTIEGAAKWLKSGHGTGYRLFRGTLETNKTTKATIWTEKAIPAGATVRWDVVYSPSYGDGYVYPHMDEGAFFSAYESACECVKKEMGGRIVPVVIETITTSEWKVEEVK